MKPYKIDTTEHIEVDMLGEIRAGFPSPADEEPHEKLDLVRLLVRHPASTFFFRVGGTSMVDADMDEGDIIIVDRAIEPYNGCSAVCYIDGEFTLKEFKRDRANNCAWLIPHNDSYSPIKVTEDNDFMVWGVLTYTIKKLHR